MILFGGFLLYSAHAMPGLFNFLFIKKKSKIKFTNNFYS